MKKYYEKLDILRIISCILILLYHMQIIKGGYLAVCSFFVLSGFLSTSKAMRKKKFSFKEYYLGRLKRVYLPLIIVTFVSIFVISFIKAFPFFNLKPETTSIIGCYNNFWQLNANLDYFSRNINSPFIHLWYISIFIQYELVFPFIYLFFKKIKEKFNKRVLLSVLIIIVASLTACFYIVSLNDNIMFSYYNSFTRLFSYLMGILIAFAIKNKQSLVIKDPQVSKKILWCYLIIFIILNIFVAANSKLYAIAMIAVSFISMRMIEYSTLKYKRKKNPKLMYISSLTYNIYLWQYPVIFVIGYLAFNNIITSLLVVLITIILSILLKFGLENSKNKIVLRKIVLLSFIVLAIFGGIKYITAKDYTKEMNNLKQELAENEKLIQQKQKEYDNKIAQDELDWNKVMNELEQDQNKLQEVVSNLPIIFVGDSIMEDSAKVIYNAFPNAYIDAKMNRSGYAALQVIEDLNNNNKIGDVVVIGIGSNGLCSSSCIDSIASILKDKVVFWLTITNDWETHALSRIYKIGEDYPNINIIDWYKYSLNHQDWFVADGYHLTYKGMKYYIEFINKNIYDYYLQKYKLQKEDIINKHNEALNNKISIYGNDLLLNMIKYINLEDAKINSDNYTFKSLKAKIEEDKNNNTLNKKVVFLFDDKLSLSKEQYEEILALLKDNNVYIVSINEYIDELDNATIINFGKEIKNNKDYLMSDMIHLTDKGNIRLSEILLNTLK